MATPTYDISIPAGDTRTLTFRYKNSDGSAIDLTGASFVFTGTWTSGGAGSLVKDSSTGISVPVPSNGQVTIAFTTANTNAMPSGRSTSYTWVRTQSGTVTTDFTGFVEIT